MQYYPQQQQNWGSPISQQQSRMQGSMGSMKQAFTTPETLIDRPNYSNKGGMLHNNIGHTIQSEHVVEYKIHINSQDRNTSAFPSPFKFSVPFGYGDPQQPGQNSISIDRRFKNIKYATINSIILPRTLAIDVSKVGHADGVFVLPANSTYNLAVGTFPVGFPAENPSNQSTIENHKCIIVKITELTSDRNLSTSTYLGRDTFMFIPDTDLGLDSVLWKPLHNNSVIYQNSLLANISKLTFTVYDESGNILTLTDTSGNPLLNISNLSVFGNGTQYTYNTLAKTFGTSSSTLKYTDNSTQVLFNLTLGVIENEINTETNY